MLTDYQGRVLHWKQPKLLKPYKMTLLAGEEVVATYRYEPVRMIATVTSPSHSLTLTPAALGTEYHITADEMETPVALITEARRRKTTFAVSDGLRYEWDARGLWGFTRVFAISGGPEVLRAEASVWSLIMTNATLTLNHSDIPARDLLVLCMLAVHHVVLLRESFSLG